jgi:GTP-binding protein
MADTKILTTNIFRGACDFFWGAASADQLPPADKPEIAFAGRSNVGKSSLINALTGRKALARTSNTPGRTQQLNFFNLGDLLTLVDMPGYGFAKVSKTQKAEWHTLIHDYLRGRAPLRCVLLLIDSRHGLKDVDNEIFELLDKAAVSYRIVLTKADKADNLEKIFEDTKIEMKKRVAAHPEISVTSSEKNTGIEELREIIVSYAQL